MTSVGKERNGSWQRSLEIFNCMFIISNLDDDCVGVSYFLNLLMSALFYNCKRLSVP